MANYKLVIHTDDAGELSSIATALAGLSAGAEADKPAARRGRPPKPETPAAPPPPPAAPAAPSWDDAPAKAPLPTEAELMAAANAAVEKLGAEGAARIKGWLATNFESADGGPGKLRQLADAHKAAALKGMQAVAAGQLTI